MIKIEKGRPLPAHTKLDYDECCAKIVLEQFFPNEYSNLQISDRPDLRDINRNIGIEVTSAIPQKEQEAVALACEIPYIDPIEQNKRIEYLRKNGYEYTEYGMSHPIKSYSWSGKGYPNIESTSCMDFINAVERKLKKLNSGYYAELSRYDLFINSELFIDDWMPAKLIDKLCALSTFPHNYTLIYLLSLDGLFVFNTESQVYSMKPTENRLGNVGRLARKMVEEGEADDKA